MQQVVDMILRIPNSERAPDEKSNAFRSPHWRIETKRKWSSREHFWQPGKFFTGKFGMGTRLRDAP
jgi:hypothetical protein